MHTVTYGGLEEHYTALQGACPHFGIRRRVSRLTCLCLQDPECIAEPAPADAAAMLAAWWIRQRI